MHFKNNTIYDFKNSQRMPVTTNYYVTYARDDYFYFYFQVNT